MHRPHKKNATLSLINGVGLIIFAVVLSLYGCESSILTNQKPGAETSTGDGSNNPVGIDINGTQKHPNQFIDTKKNIKTVSFHELKQRVYNVYNIEKGSAADMDMQDFFGLFRSNLQNTEVSTIHSSMHFRYALKICDLTDLNALIPDDYDIKPFWFALSGAEPDEEDLSTLNDILAMPDASSIDKKYRTCVYVSSTIPSLFHNINRRSDGS